MSVILGEKGGCFRAGTLISVPGGTKPIEDIRNGDKVICFDDLGKLHTSTAYDTVKHDQDCVYEARLWGGAVLYVTGNHWVLNQYNRFVPVSSLTDDDAMVDGNGHLCPVLSVEPHCDEAVYNFKVDGYHTYIANGLRVHNGGRGVGVLREYIEGAKGGGDKGGGGSVYTPREDPNSLRSKSTARVIDVLSEGEILGLADGAKSVFFDGTPLQNADGSYNFNGVEYVVRYGLPDQDFATGFASAEAEMGVNQEVTKATPVYRTITDPDVDAVRIRLRAPAFYKQTTQGDLIGTKVELSIEISSDGGPYQPAKPNYGWSDFKSTTLNACRGLKIQINHTASSAGAYTLAWEYRKVGSTTWTSGGSLSQIVTPGDVTSLSQQWVGDGDGWGYYQPVATGTTKTLTNTWTLSDLPEGQYEVRSAGHGAIVSRSEYSPRPIVIEGKCVSVYEEDHRLELPVGGAPWVVKISRITDDQDTAAIQDTVLWYSYTEIIDNKFSYPDTAYIALTVDAELFGGRVPQRAYEIKGIKIKVPSNYNPATRAYAGLWNGTFKLAWSDSPPWILYDLLTNKRYGLGESISESQVDKWGLYTIAQYCDELVDDGFGGKEPRFTLNCVINTRQEAFALVNTMVSVFRGMAFWSTGSVQVTQDCPKDPTRLVSPANVVGGEFKYEGSALKARHTAALVSWNDPNDGYKLAVEVVEDPDAIAKWGWRPTDVVAFGCTSKGQAVRLGRWILDSEKHETEMVYYTAGFDHADCVPGEIVAVADPSYAGMRFGGRIASASGTTITLDAPVTLASGQSYELLIVLPNSDVEVKPVVSGSGQRQVLQVQSAFSQTPLPGAMFIVSGTDVEPRLFRVLSKRESAKNTYEILGLFYDTTKFARVEQNLKLDPPNYGNLPTGPIKPPTYLTYSENLYRTNGVIKNRLTISWGKPDDPRVVLFRVDVRRPTTGWTLLTTTADTTVEVPDAEVGGWGVRVQSIAMGGAGSNSRYVEISYFWVAGKTAPPADVTGFVVDARPDGIYMKWNAVSDIDLSGYLLYQNGIYKQFTQSTELGLGPLTAGEYRWDVYALDDTGHKSTRAATASYTVVAPSAPAVTVQVIDNFVALNYPAQRGTHHIARYNVKRGPYRGTAEDLVTTEGAFTSAFEPASGSITYWVQAVDIAGNGSLWTKVVATVAQPADYVLLTTWASALGGDKTNAVLDGGRLLAPVNTDETWEQHFTDRGWDTVQDQLDAGYAYFAQPTPTAAQYVEVFDYGGLVTNVVVTVNLVKAAVEDTVGVTPLLEISTDNVVWTPIATGWQALASAMRYLRVTLDIASASDKALVALTLDVQLDIQLKNDSGAGVAAASDVDGTQVDFNLDFVDITSITVTPGGTTPVIAVYNFLDVPNPTGFKVLLFDKTGTRVSGPFSWTARGY